MSVKAVLPLFAYKLHTISLILTKLWTYTMTSEHEKVAFKNTFSSQFTIFISAGNIIVKKEFRFQYRSL